MIEPVFNEFSAYPLCDSQIVSDSRFITLVELIKHLERYGIKRVRYESSIHDIPFTTQKSLGVYCNDIINNRPANAAKLNYVYYLFSRIKPPFINDAENVFPDNIEKATYYRVADDGHEEVISENPISLLAASFLKSFTIGFDNNTDSSLQLRLFFRSRENCGRSKTYTKDINLICVSTKESCLSNSRFIEFLASQEDLQVPLPKDKKSSFNLPEHHGQKECKSHGEDLLKNPYVKDILTTRKFNGGESDYISKVYHDGRIEVRLYWTHSGYGLLIATSGEDIVQTTWIANQLNKAFGKKR